MFVKKGVGSLILFLLFPHVFAQIGGRHAFEFLNLTSSPRVAALGGKLVAANDNDLSLVYYNPSLLSGEMNRHLALNYVNYFAGINYGYASYAMSLKNNRNLAFGVQYINYGRFTGADETGLIDGSFSAAEYAFNIAGSFPVYKHFILGADVRPILSVYEKYQSFGLSSDFGITYHHPDQLYSLALVVRNLGSQIVPYDHGNYEPLPFEIQLGYTQKLKYAPFIFYVTAHHLETLDMSVKNDLAVSNTYTSGYTETSAKHGLGKFPDQVMRHMIFGVEFVPLNNFYVRMGYNYQRRQELKIDPRAATVGFSWGFGISISRVQINFGRATYHLAGASNHFSIATNLSEFYHSSAEVKNLPQD